MLLNGEASMALIWSTRASLIEKDSGGSIKFVWDQGLISPGAMGVLNSRERRIFEARRLAEDPMTLEDIFVTTVRAGGRQ